jgi:hypothetical protein
MWVNVIRGGGGDFVVGTSPSPEGPFTFKTAFYSALKGGGDFDLLVDDDDTGNAYLIYTATGAGHVMSIEQLVASPRFA